MSLENESLQLLYFRRGLLERIIEDAEREKDPRIDEPKRQLKNLNVEIGRREQPQDLTVGLKSLDLKVERK